MQVARLSCAMVDDTEGVKMVRSAANQLQTLCPQVRMLKYGNNRKVGNEAENLS